MDQNDFLRKMFKEFNEALLTCRRENFRTRARVKALEHMIRESIPKDKRDAWHDELNRQTKFCLQQILVSLEKQNPAAAAQLDDREAWEVGDDV
jgi:hypothetical protein